MVPPVTAAVDALAVARVARLVVEDDIAEPLRAAAKSSGIAKLDELVNCRMCVSVWAGLAVATGVMPRKITYALALSEAAILLRRAADSLPTRW